MPQIQLLLNYRKSTPTGSVTAVHPCSSREECDLYTSIMLEDASITDVILIEKIDSLTVLKSSISGITAAPKLDRREYYQVYDSQWGDDCPLIKTKEEAVHYAQECQRDNDHDAMLHHKESFKVRLVHVVETELAF